MEAKELMMGDWVHYINPSNNRRVGIGDFESPKEIEPIPLTPKILEMNGWILVENEYRSPEDISYKESLRLQIGEDGNAFWWIVGYVIVTPINYVHKLQHTLHLCGLNDLADNFKV